MPASKLFKYIYSYIKVQNVQLCISIYFNKAIHRHLYFSDQKKLPNSSQEYTLINVNLLETYREGF